jgi:hypothetical protein
MTGIRLCGRWSPVTVGKFTGLVQNADVFEGLNAFGMSHPANPVNSPLHGHNNLIRRRRGRNRFGSGGVRFHVASLAFMLQESSLW